MPNIYTFFIPFNQIDMMFAYMLAKLNTMRKRKTELDNGFSVQIYPHTHEHTLDEKRKAMNSIFSSNLFLLSLSLPIILLNSLTHILVAYFDAITFHLIINLCDYFVLLPSLPHMHCTPFILISEFSVFSF